MRKGGFEREFDGFAGPGYRLDTVFNLVKMQPYTLTELLRCFRLMTGNIALYLPRTSDVRQIADHTLHDEKTTVMHYCMQGASKVSEVITLPTRLALLTCRGNLRVLWFF